jgi:hypothetical protein
MYKIGFYWTAYASVTFTLKRVHVSETLVVTNLLTWCQWVLLNDAVNCGDYIAPVFDEWVSEWMNEWMNESGALAEVLGETLSTVCLLHHKFHVGLRRTEPRPQRWKTVPQHVWRHHEQNRQSCNFVSVFQIRRWSQRKAYFSLVFLQSEVFG